MQKWLDKYHTLLRTVLFAVFLLNGIFYIPRQSITADEGDHYNYAVRFVKGHPEKTRPFDDASAMPLSAINTVPRITQQLLHPDLHRNDYGTGDIINGRYVTLLISLFIGFYVYRWSKDLYGKRAALLSLFLFVFCPNISAHASLVTTDAYSALFTIAPLYHYWRYCKERSLKQFIFFSVTLAIAQLSKQSLTFLYPVFILLFFFRLFYISQKLITLKKVILNFLLILAIQLLILNIGFQFNHTGMPLNHYNFRSSFFNSIQKNSFFLKSIPIPIPAPYVYGLDLTKNIDEIGPGHPESSPKIFLLGESRAGKGFWNYYFISLLFKTPISLLIAFFLSLFLICRKKARRWCDDELFLLFPIFFFLVYFDFFYDSQVGLRHILLIFPLVHVFCGIIVKELVYSRRNLFLISLLTCYSLFSFYYFFPHLLPYTNELITDKKTAYKILGAANLDYNQATKDLVGYLNKNPEAHYAPEKPGAGKFIISINDLLGLDQKKDYTWLRNNFKPVDHLVFTYLIFDISDDELINKKLSAK